MCGPLPPIDEEKVHPRVNHSLNGSPELFFPHPAPALGPDCSLRVVAPDNTRDAGCTNTVPGGANLAEGKMVGGATHELVWGEAGVGLGGGGGGVTQVCRGRGMPPTSCWCTGRSYIDRAGPPVLQGRASGAP